MISQCSKPFRRQPPTFGRQRPEDPVLAALAARLTAGGGPAFAKYVEVLEETGESDPDVLDRIRQAIGGEERLRIRYTARSTGESNHPSIPVSRSRRVSTTIPWADRSHQSRWSEASHAARDSGESKR